MNSGDYISQWIDWAFSNYSEGNPTLNRHQMKLAVISLTGKKPVLNRNKKYFTNQDLREFVGQIDKDDLIGNLEIIYDSIDKDGKGYVSLDDIQEAAKNNHATLPSHTIANAFKAGDKDNDGRIPYIDFIKLVKSGMIDLGII